MAVRQKTGTAIFNRDLVGEISWTSEPVAVAIEIAGPV